MALKVERDERGLTPVQAAFVDAYTGNIVETCRIIGAAPGYGQRLMTHPAYAHVRVILRAKVRAERDERTGHIVASRLERLAFWTDMMRDSRVEHKDRLRASELLGKAHMDFVEKQVIETAGPVQVSVVRGLDERLDQLRKMDFLE